MEELPIETLLSSSEVAKLLHITPVTLCRWRKARKYNLPFLRLSNRIFYRKDDILAFLKLRQNDVQIVKKGRRQ